MDAGPHTIEWNADALPSGMYFAVLKSANQQKIQKLLLLKQYYPAPSGCRVCKVCLFGFRVP